MDDVGEMVTALTKEIEEISQAMDILEIEINAKHEERVRLFKRQESLKKEKLRLLGWNV